MTEIDIIEQARLRYAYLNQGEVWFPKGKPPIRIVDMDPAWRHNAAAFLRRRAAYLAIHYEVGEISTIWGAMCPEVVGEDDGQPIYGELVSLAPSPGSIAEMALEEELEAAHAQRDADPEGWLKDTALYRALIADLPEDAAELAKHWSDCAVRTGGGVVVCTCWVRHVTECPKRTDIDADCHCRDYSPEWTR